MFVLILPRTVAWPEEFKTNMAKYDFGENFAKYRSNPGLLGLWLGAPAFEGGPPGEGWPLSPMGLQKGRSQGKKTPFI